MKRRGSRVLLLALSILLPAFLSSQESQPQEPKRPELKHRSDPNSLDAPNPTTSPVPHDLLSSHRLSPPLHGSARIHFSSDGSHLLIQDNAGIYVLSRSPLQLLLYVDLNEAYPAMFSPDSQEVLVLGHNLVLTTLRLRDRDHPVRRELQLKSGCLDAKLSPDSSWIACLTPDFSFDLYSTSDLQRVYSQKVTSELFSSPVRMPLRIPISLRRDSPFAGPFGFSTASDFEPLANRGLFHAGVTFSPDSKFVLLDEQSEFCRIDLPSLTKTNLPGALRKHPRTVLGITPSQGWALLYEPKGSAYEVVSLAKGEVVAPASFSADSVSLASDPRYALLSQIESPSVTVFDLQNNRSVKAPPNLGIDVWNEELALLDSDGALRIYHLGQDQAVAGGKLPLGPIHSIRSGLADGSLSTLAVSVWGAGGTFDLTTGNRISQSQSFRGVTFAAADSASLALPQRGKLVPSVSRWSRNQPEPTNGSPWTAEKAVDFVSSRRAFVSYSFDDLEGGGHAMIGLRGEMPFELRGLEPATGRELWRHRYEVAPPIPFADPQGANIVLGWKANSDPARSIAKRFPSSREAYKREKIKEHDSFFEVLDAATGDSLGGVLVQFGAGPSSFDSASAAGDLLFLTKDDYRISLFQLNNGKLLGRLRGEHPAASEAAKVFALDDGDAKVAIYSIETAKKLALRAFPDLIAYLCFSETGDRLLVLTAHQQAFILDVKKTIEEFPAPASSMGETP